MSLRFGLIGTGGGGHLFAGALAARPGGAELVAVCSRNRERATDFGAGYGVTEVHTDWRDLIRADLDAVCLASPTGDHARMAVKAASHGLHVLTEKPIAATVADADRMIEACHRAGVTLGCIYMYRFLETALRMKEAITGGLIGRPLMAECSGLFYRDQPYYDSGEWRGSWESEGGGSLVTQTSHTLDLMLWMLGDVEEALAFYSTSPLHRIEVEDITVGVLRFAGGALATLLSTTAAVPPQPRYLTVRGTEGTVGLVDDRLDRWDVPGGPSPEIEELMNAGPVDRGDTLTQAGFADSSLHFLQMEDFVAAVAEGRPPLVDGHEGRRTTAIMEALYDSARSGEAVRPRSRRRG